MHEWMLNVFKLIALDYVRIKYHYLFIREFRKRRNSNLPLNNQDDFISYMVCIVYMYTCECAHRCVRECMINYVQEKVQFWMQAGKVISETHDVLLTCVRIACCFSVNKIFKYLIYKYIFQLGQLSKTAGTKKNMLMWKKCIGRGLLTGKYTKDHKPEDGRVGWVEGDTKRAGEAMPSWSSLQGNQQVWALLDKMAEIAQSHGNVFRVCF